MAEPPYQLAAYYFPGYHPDARTDLWHGAGWSEWELVRRAEPRFAGHRQPRVPLWGYEDESQVAAAERRIAAAADHGLSAFIWDWYWYEDGPFLDGALERGYLRAGNNARLRFALMWANHDWINIHPASRAQQPAVLAPGAVSPDAFRRATDYITAIYFSHPSYWRVPVVCDAGGGLYFSIYELMRLIQSLGGVSATRAALDDWRARTRAAGLGEMHLNAVVWGLELLRGEQHLSDANAVLAALGLDSVTSYVWVHHQPLRHFPATDYREYAALAAQDWERLAREYALPYYPNVTVGWDASPRTVQSDRFENLGYPFMPVLEGNTPAAFREALLAARAFLDRQQAQPKVLTLNAWNEWTEGSYLEPDTEYGLGYLEAIRDVFGTTPR